MPNNDYKKGLKQNLEIITQVTRCQKIIHYIACVFSSRRVKFKVTGLIKWEFEYTLFALQDELVDRLLSIKDKIFRI
jgi:hypothetical protein